MRRALIRAGWAGLLLAVLFSSGGLVFFHSAPAPVSGAASVSAAPAPTSPYASELGPAVLQLPRSVGAGLPPSGAGADPTVPWPKLAGFTLVLLGGLLIHMARTLRAEGRP